MRGLEGPVAAQECPHFVSYLELKNTSTKRYIMQKCKHVVAKVAVGCKFRKLNMYNGIVHYFATDSACR